MPGPDAPITDPAPLDRPADAAPTDADPALRDAQAIAERVAADEAAADAERERLTREPLPEVAAEGPMTPGGFEPSERLHAVRHSALIEGGTHDIPVGGTLFLTSTRLLHAGVAGSVSVPLAAIADMAVAMERVLLVGLTDGSDLAIEVDQPRLLRVQVAAARAAARGAGG
jgi:hypothetical protein